MGNALEFILKLTDMLTPGMKQAAQISDSTATRISGDVNKINSSTTSLSNGFGSKMANEFKQPIDKVTQLNSKLNETKNISGGLLSGLGGILASAGISVGIGAAIKESSNAETAKMNYSTLLGSKDKGAALYGQLTQYGNATALQNSDVYSSANTLLSFGIAGEKVLPTIKMLGDVSLGNSEKFNSLSLAFAQTQSAGRLMGQDLLQYINAGFNPLNEISKITGESMASLKDKMEKGGISADMVSLAFQHATGAGGMFNNALANAADTTAGKWGSFMGSLQTRLIQLGDFLKPVTNGVIDFFSNLLNGEPVALTIAAAIGGIALAIWGGTIATNAWTIAQGALNVIMNANPIILIISLIVLLGVWIYNICKKYEGWGTSINALWQIIKSFFSLSVTGWKSFYETIVYYLEYAWLKLKDWGETLVQFGKNVGTALGQALHGQFSEAYKTLNTEIHTTASAQIAALEKQHAANQAGYAKDAANAVQTINTQWQKVGLKAVPTTAAGSGVNPITANGAGSGVTSKDFGSLATSTGKSKADAINSGGQRSIVINIAKQVGAESIHVNSGKETADEIESLVREAMRRMLLSVNGNAVSTI